ncbi:MAG: PD40 domain-containing protein [Phycisphaerae bacterium]|nr:MAG: hypothetical protein F9K17_05285 [Phycisphaerae bacterium]MBE7457742.1 PD40 domain-containing protein [Planctomycetia bacterium]MCK6463739.1 carboxypeptidase regulatory-like domain-containing protein [Phycisphaerae bacterium]MCL4717546.1 PD40 domain-containing protein [Phycisphaerae bacterium]NUQ08435.1 PD40 domain-containing protein [Phycisphaerae bacterium]
MTRSEGRGRAWRLGVAGVALATVIVVVVLSGSRARVYYTDADTIREPAESAALRDVLWQPPTPLPSLINLDGDEYEPRVSPDGLTLYFVCGKPGENADIFVASRTPDGWTPPQPLVALNTPDDELGPAPTVDGRILYFYSNRPGGRGGYDLWMARRGESGWQEPINLGSGINTEFNEYGVAPSPDGRTLYFASNRPASGEAVVETADAWKATLRETFHRRPYDLYSVQLDDDGAASNIAPLSVLNTSHSEGAPCVSPVGDFLYFASDRPAGLGGFDLYRARILAGVVQTPESLGATINSTSNDLDPALSLGGFALTFSSDRPLDGAAPDPAQDYNLYATASREVFRQSEPVDGGFPWSAFWREIWPNLLWILLGLLALLLLLRLFKATRDRQLSLLARCLLASLFAHLLIFMLMTFWNVTAAVADVFRGRGSVKVSLAPSVGAESIFSQIRGDLVAVSLPDPEAEASQKEFVELASLAPRIEQSAISQRIELPVSATLEAVMPPDGSAPAQPPTTSMPSPEAPDMPAELDVTTPAPPTVTATAESAPSQPPVHVQSSARRAEAPRIEPLAAPAPAPAVKTDLVLPDRASSGPSPVSTIPRDVADPRLPQSVARTPSIEPPASPLLQPLAPHITPGALIANEAAVADPTVVPMNAVRASATAPAMTSVDPITPQPAPTSPKLRIEPETLLGAPRFSDAALPVAEAPRTSRSELLQVPGAPAPALTVRTPRQQQPLSAAAEADAPPALAEAQILEPTSHRSVDLPTLHSETLTPEAPEFTARIEAPVVIEPMSLTGIAPSAAMPRPEPPPTTRLTPDIPPVAQMNISLPQADPSIEIPGAIAPPEPVGRIQGRVRDAGTGEPLPGATVQLDIVDGPSILTTTDVEGRYEMSLPPMPEHFAMSASLPGYAPSSQNVPARRLRRGVLAVDFALEPLTADVLAMDATPDVHHLGNDMFEGAINSQFQRRAQGESFVAQFVIEAGRLGAAAVEAEISMLAKGVQCPPRIEINGQRLRYSFEESPPDGSFGPFRARFNAAWLAEGVNTIRVRTTACRGDLDDFEFVNVQVRLVEGG